MKKSILIIEDKQINRAFLKNLLAGEYLILEADNGQVGLQILSQTYNEISCVLLDLMMPVMDGFTFLKTVSKIDRYRALPIIAITQDPTETNEIQALSLGAWDFIGGAIEPQILKLRLKNVVERSQLSWPQQREYILQHDTLTGLYNRAGFLSQAKKLLEESTPQETFLLLFFNIRGFKAINELFSTSGGDQVLLQSAALLKNSSLHPLLCARLECDHFVCLIHQKDWDATAMVAMCQRVYEQDGRQYSFYGRCGVYRIIDKHMPVSAMMDRAQLAKKFIDDDFVKPYAVYDATMWEGLVTQKELTSELKRALKNQEFQVYYQPIFDVDGQQLVSAEALVRWQHPHRGLLAPIQFIPTFEQNGYITELDHYVGHCVATFQRQRLDQEKATVPIAINLSRMDFYQVNLYEKIKQILEQITLPSSLLHIEITESAYTALTKNGSELVDLFREKGVQILIDDFGSGYSSFSCLQEFNFDIIKLDMGFVQKIGVHQKSEWILRDLIRLAHHIDAKVIAEGVETPEQALFLKQANCDYLQGYLFAKPMPQSDFEQLLDQRAAWLPQAQFTQPSAPIG